MILSDKAILEEMEKGDIVIEPFLRSALGSNSYDVHLGKHLAIYEDEILDARKHNVGFCNTWTLEISCVHPVRIYAGMPIGQLIYFEVEGEVGMNYATKANAKYTVRTERPVESMMWKNKF